MDEQTKGLVLVAGRIRALEWMLTTLMADALASAPNVHAAAIRFKTGCGAKVTQLIAEANAAGDPRGFPIACFADALIDLQSEVIRTVAAQFADTGTLAN